jgi:hypothetical protein
VPQPISTRNAPDARPLHHDQEGPIENIAKRKRRFDGFPFLPLFWFSYLASFLSNSRAWHLRQQVHPVPIIFTASNAFYRVLAA